MKFASTCRWGVRGDAQRSLSTEATGTFLCDRSTDPDAAVPLPLLDEASTTMTSGSRSLRTRTRRTAAAVIFVRGFV